NLTEATSHEIAESVTDPGASLSSPGHQFIGWEDDSPPAPDLGHQIGDIAGVEHVDVRLNGLDGWLVQKEAAQDDSPMDPRYFTLNPPVSLVKTGPDGTTYGLTPGGQLYQLQNGAGLLIDSFVVSFAGDRSGGVYYLRNDGE